LVAQYFLSNYAYIVVICNQNPNTTYFPSPKWADMAQVEEGLVKIRYRFRDEKKFISIKITESQYQNLLHLPIIEECNIVKVSREF